MGRSVDEIIEELRQLLHKGDQDGFDDMLKKLAEDYEFDIHELIRRL